MKTLPAKIIAALENEKIPLLNCLFVFFFATTLRNFIESYSQIHNYLNKADGFDKTMMHFYFYYTMIAMALIALLSYVTQSPVQLVARVVLSGSIILLLAPIVDLLFSQGQGIDIFYPNPQEHTNLLRLYLTYFVGFSGSSVGLKSEVLIALIGCFFYLRTKNLNIFLSLFYTWIGYSIIIAISSSLYFINWLLTICQFHYIYSSMMMIHFYLIGIFAVGILLFYLSDKKLFLCLLKDIGTSSMLHYQLMLALGITIALTNNSATLYQQLHTPPDTVINIMFCAISIFFANVFANIINHVSDIGIGKTNHANCPVIKNLIDMKTYTIMGYTSLVLSLSYAAVVGAKAYLLIGVTMASYFIYAAPPFRFKRVPLLSKTVIALNSIVLVILGYLLIQQTLYYFPNGLFFIFLIGYTCAANFIDLKNISDDRAAGIMTIPTLLTSRYAKIIIGLAFLGTYLSCYYLIQNIYCIPLLIGAGSVQFYLINKPTYREWQIQTFYNISVIFLILYLYLAKPYWSS